MAIGKQGLRAITVDGVRYLWRADGTDEGIRVLVALPAALGRGKPRSQQLVFCVPHQAGPPQDRQTIVSPRLVRQAILRALERGFSGGPGMDDVVLPDEDVPRPGFVRHRHPPR